MDEQFSREALLVGVAGVEKLHQKHVAVFGLGGVGGYAVEALVRAGIGTMTLVDPDRISPSNLNRQIIATQDTVGMLKTQAFEERIHSINPNCKVLLKSVFFLPEEEEKFDFSQYDYVVDAIDTVSGKIGLIEACHKVHVPVISAMGAGNKLDATGFLVSDIEHTSVCPLARVMRRELKKRGISGVKVVYSKEQPLTPKEISGAPEEMPLELSTGDQKGRTELQGREKKEPVEAGSRRSTPGSMSYVPGVAGLILAGEVIQDLLKA